MREKYESLSLATLKDLAKARGLKGISTMRKPELIERMLEELEKKAYLEIVTGQKPLSYFDEFVKEWKRQGGEKIRSEVEKEVEK